MQGDHERRAALGRERSDQLIAAAVAAAETRSAAEIAVALVPRAEPYRLTALLSAVMIFALVDMVFGWRGDTLVTWLATWLASWTVPVVGSGVTNWLGPIIAVLLAIVLFLACEHTSLGVMLTPPALRRQACLARARLLFLDHGIDATEDRLGLLICVCEAERHIEILPDRGIAAAIPAERWATLIAAFRDHKRKVPLEAALVQLIALVADELAPRFPFWAGQSNELPDRPFRV